MFKTRVETRAAGEWFHLSFEHLMASFVVYKIADHEKVWSILFFFFVLQ